MCNAPLYSGGYQIAGHVTWHWSSWLGAIENQNTFENGQRWDVQRSPKITMSIKWSEMKTTDLIKILYVY